MTGTFELDGRKWRLDFADRCPHCFRHASLEIIAAVKSPDLNECAVTFFCRELSFADFALTGKVLGNELEGLGTITGTAYRKALENLVKNYLAAAYPNEAETIKGEKLGKSISRIEYPRIRALAKVAAWIGNDETLLAEKVGDQAIERVARD